MCERDDEFPGGRMSSEQKLCLVEFMENHPSLVRSRYLGVERKKTLESLWKVLTVQLNSLEGPGKSATKWKRSWVQLKNKIKKKASQIRNVSHGTADGLLPTPLNYIEERILDLMNSDTMYNNQTDMLQDSNEPQPCSSSEQSISDTNTQKFASSIPRNELEPTSKPLEKRPTSGIPVEVMDHDYEPVRESAEFLEIHPNILQNSPKIELETNCANNNRITPERDSLRKRIKQCGRDPLEHFMNNEDEFNAKLDNILTNMQENNTTMKDILQEYKEANKLRRDMLKERKETNSLFKEIIMNLKQK